jgi:hypothetical protein
MGVKRTLRADPGEVKVGDGWGLKIRILVLYDIPNNRKILCERQICIVEILLEDLLKGIIQIIKGPFRRDPK